MRSPKVSLPTLITLVCRYSVYTLKFELPNKQTGDNKRAGWNFSFITWKIASRVQTIRFSTFPHLYYYEFVLAVSVSGFCSYKISLFLLFYQNRQWLHQFVQQCNGQLGCGNFNKNIQMNILQKVDFLISNACYNSRLYCI